MKTKSLVLLLTCLVILSCRKEVTPTQIASIQAVLKLDDKVKNAIPAHYKSEGQVIFVNEQGDEKILTHRFYSDFVPSAYDGKPYESERISAVLTEPDNGDYRISVSANVNYTVGGQPAQFNSIDVFTSANQGGIASIGFYPPNVTLVDEFLASQTLLNRNFSSVFRNNSYMAKTLQHYSEVFYTEKDGVVGFRDRDNKLWVLKE